MNVRVLAPLTLLALAACASGPDPQYALVKADATIPFAAHTVRNFTVGPDDTLILEAPGRRLYRAELDPYCQSLLRSEYKIGVENGVTSQIDRFSSVRINGERCRLRSLDEVVRVKPTSDAPASTAPN